MRDYIYNACEEIDASVFSGDAFYDKEHRKQLREYMARWTRELMAIEESLGEEEEEEEV